MKPDKSGGELGAKKTNLETLEENWELKNKSGWRKWNEGEKNSSLDGYVRAAAGAL